VPTRSFPVATVAAYATIVLIWGTTWLAIKISLTGLPPVFGAGVRFVVASLLLYAIGIALRVDFRRAAPPLHLVAVLALTMFGLSYALTYVAESHLASGLVAVLYGTMPFFVFGFAHVMAGERASAATVAGALLALAGVATISLAGSVHGDVLYVAAAVAASALSGFGNVYLKRHAQAEPLATLPPAMLAGGIAMTAWGGLFERIDWHAALEPQSLVAVAYLAAAGSALAFYLNHWLLKRIDSGIIALSALMVPVIAVAAGAVFAHERLGPRDLTGAALVIGGVWLALGRRRAPHVQRVAKSHSPA
jgi:drug/metabolite transporter (DMT)-like permease